MTEKAYPERRIQRLEMRGIVKRFPGVLANDHVDLEVNAGEVLALLGENGAGKSTLMKILYGLYRPDEGEILINDRHVTIESPNDAIAQGIGMVHQHFMLVPTLTVVENVVLGLPSSRGPLLDLDIAARRLESLGREYGLEVDPWAVVWQLSVGEQQRVEILKVLYRGADLIILDEPTAVLTPQEVDELFPTLKGMIRRGHSIIFITHKLHEVMAISDRVTVLRNGRHISTLRTEETTPHLLARLMVGRELLESYDKPPMEPGPVVLRMENVEALDDKGLPALRGLSLEVRSGEIVGLAGVSGNGQRELAEVIAGLRPVTGGSIYLDGEEITNKSPLHIIRAGMGYIPEDRIHVGTIPTFSVAENIILKDSDRPPIARGPFLDFDTIRSYATRLVEEFNIKTPSLDTPVRYLSGGNIQKIILTREIARRPSFLLAAQPTRGLDIGATEYVHQRLLEARKEGKALLLVSEDLDEIMRMSDRIAVIYEGQLMGIIPVEEATPERLGLMMAGMAAEEE